MPVEPGDASPPNLAAVLERNPFHASRRPAAVRYSFARTPAAEVSAAPPAPKPQLVLTGLIWGRDAAAIIEGLPGIEGARVLKAGEVLGGIRVRSIGANRVVLTGLDTAWTLEVRRPWR